MIYDLMLILCATVTVIGAVTTLILMSRNQSRRKVWFSILLVFVAVLFASIVQFSGFIQKPDLKHAKITVSEAYARRECKLIIIDTLVYSFTTKGDTLFLKELGPHESP